MKPEPFKIYRPLSRSLKMPSGAREQGLAVIVFGLAIAIGFGWTPLGDRLASIGFERATGSLAGVVPDGPRGGFRFRGVYLFTDASGSVASVLTSGSKPMRTRTDGPRDSVAAASSRGPGGIVSASGVELGSVQTTLPSGPVSPGTQAGGITQMLGLSGQEFPAEAIVAYDVADPSRAQVIGLEDRLWPGILVGLAIAGFGVWMRRRLPEDAGEPSS